MRKISLALPIFACLLIIGAIFFKVLGMGSPIPEALGGAAFLALITWNRIDIRDIRKDIGDILSRLDRAGII